METLCAFLNGKGGQVVFGVTAAGRIVGQMVADSTLQDVAAEIAKLEPAASIAQTRVKVAAGRLYLTRAFFAADKGGVWEVFREGMVQKSPILGAILAGCAGVG